MCWPTYRPQRVTSAREWPSRGMPEGGGTGTQCLGALEINTQRVWHPPFFLLFRFPPLPRITGGLLAEDVSTSLGKTTIMLALVHLNAPRAMPSAVAASAARWTHSLPGYIGRRNRLPRWTVVR